MNGNDQPNKVQKHKLEMVLRYLMEQRIEWPEGLEDVLTKQPLNSDDCDLLIALGCSYLREAGKMPRKEKKEND